MLHNLFKYRLSSFPAPELDHPVKHAWAQTNVNKVGVAGAHDGAAQVIVAGRGGILK
jgi:hypothetical protein